MTTIEWTDAVWNPSTGCDRTSPGCDKCYALTFAKRLKAMGQTRYQTDGDPRTSGPGFGIKVHNDVLDLPLHWRKPRRIFVNSMSDLFHPDVPDAFILDVWSTMVASSRHTYQILTKRSQRMAQFTRRLAWDDDDPGLGDDPARCPHFAGRILDGAEEPLPNVWLGVSIENDAYVFRANHLRRSAAAVRFLSLEPLLGPLPSLDLTGIDWVIVGAESGRGARPMDEDWVRAIRDQCGDLGIPFFFKQRLDGRGHKVHLPELDGRQWAQFPERTLT